MLLLVALVLAFQSRPRDLGRELRYAVYHGAQLEAEQLLQAHPELINQINTKPLVQPFHQASLTTLNFIEQVTMALWNKVILEPLWDEADEDFRYMEEEQMSALHIAICLNNLGLTRLLVAQGADLKLATRYQGRQPIYFAASQSPALIKLLLEHGAQANASNHYGHTPLHVATQNSNPEALTLLLEAGADPNAQNRNGATPMHSAATGTQDTNVWQILLHYGARLDLTNKTGKTALDLARQYHQTNAIQFLSARPPGQTAPP